jgi:hypothetical protein
MAWPKFRCNRSRTRDITRQERSPTPARPIWQQEVERTGLQMTCAAARQRIILSMYRFDTSKRYMSGIERVSSAATPGHVRGVGMATAGEAATCPARSCMTPSEPLTP